MISTDTKREDLKILEFKEIQEPSKELKTGLQSTKKSKKGKEKAT